MIILIENLFSKQFLSEPALPQCKCGSRDVLTTSILTCPDPVKGQFIFHIIDSNNVISNWVVFDTKYMKLADIVEHLGFTNSVSLSFR